MSEARREGGAGAHDGSLTALQTKVSELSAQISEEKPWNLGPLRVKGAVDVIALITFIISIGNLAFTLWDYFSAADIIAFPPYQVVIASSQALRRTVMNEPNAVLITAVTQYINRSPSGHSALVQRELLEAAFDIPGLQSTTMHYSPYQVVTTNTPIKDIQQTPLINVNPVADPSIIVINPQNAATHEVLFWPTGASDWYEWAKFVENGRNNGSYKEINIRISLLPAIYTKHGIFSSYGQKTLPTSCVVKLSEPDFILLSNNGWLAPVCTWESQNVG
jgi:hypothetical protein